MAAEDARIPLLEPGAVSRIDTVFDGADQIDSAGYVIKGGGGALLRENILACMARRMVIMADEGKFVEQLCRPIPVEVHPAARALVYERVREMGCNTRPADAEARISRCSPRTGIFCWTATLAS